MSTTLAPLEAPEVPVQETHRDLINKNRARFSGMLTSSKFVQSVCAWSNKESNANCFVNLAYINSHPN